MARVVRSPVELCPDLGRVVARFFVPGREEVGAGGSRAAPVVERVLALSEAVVEELAASVIDRVGSRHRDPESLLRRHAALMRSRVDDSIVVSPAREVLLGACFTHEYAIEGAALCNPSIVAHPVQPTTGGLAVVVSVRGIGEGHRSSIGFRTGVVAADGTVTIDAPGPHPVVGDIGDGEHHRSVFHAKLAELDDDRENAAFVLDLLPEQFSGNELDRRLAELDGDRATRTATSRTIGHLRALAGSSYRVTFPAETRIDERVLWPHAPVERHGMEDARFVRFVDDDGAATYLATYTAFDGVSVSQQLLRTDDFAAFDCTAFAGAAATNKGLALFPRRVNGRYAALSRSDRETNALAYSDDLCYWPTATSFQSPTSTWELLQLGNCGSPIETPAGWLVLTHAVGPLRTYTIGALLLDIDDPSQVVARSEEPVIEPSELTRGGYVPNVVYSCGAIAHGDVLVVPHGVSDQSIAFATLSIAELVDSMEPV